MAFVKSNIVGDKLSIDLDPQETQYARWARDEQFVLAELSEMVTQYLRDRWKMEAADRLASVVQSDQGALQGILFRADQELKTSRIKPVKEEVPADEKVKGKA